MATNHVFTTKMGLMSGHEMKMLTAAIKAIGGTIKIDDDLRERNPNIMSVPYVFWLPDFDHVDHIEDFAESLGFDLEPSFWDQDEGFTHHEEIEVECIVCGVVDTQSPCSNCC